MKKQEKLLPWYINNTLSEEEKTSVEEWLERDIRAAAKHHKVQQIATVVESSKKLSPSTRIDTRSLIRSHESNGRNWKAKPFVWGTPIAVIVFLLLWLFLQPGPHLQWSIQGVGVAAFRIYRAPLGSEQFELIEELPAEPTQQTYQYADSFVAPWKSYQYLIEVRDSNGTTILRRAATNDSLMTITPHIAILLTSLFLTFGMISLTQEIKLSRHYFLIV